MKQVLITGGARGIGRAITRAFAAAGYATAITYCASDKEAKKLKEEFGTEIYRCDFRDPAALGDLIRAIRTFPPALTSLSTTPGSRRAK